MKPFKFNIYKQMIPFSLLLIASLFVWFDGPLFRIHGVAPLLDMEKRIDLIGLFFICWLLKVCFFDVQAEKKIQQQNALSEDILKKLEHLKGRFLGAVKFLKSTVIHKNGKNVNLVRLPWYLVLGPTGSGKTTLLANSDVKYILAKQFKAENTQSIPPSDACNWWVTRDLVLVDVPGTYLFSQAKTMPQSLAAFPHLWQLLLDSLTKIRNENKLQGVIVTLHLPELMQNHRQQIKNDVVMDLKKRLMDILEKFGPSMPIHLVITKCDLLPGFTEFFGDSSSDEAAQAWGVTLPANENENILTVFVQRFNALIKRLNKQLIWHLHQERDPASRAIIKDFPLQIERLKESIVSMLKNIGIPHLRLFSVHLTSGTQYAVDEPSSALTTAQTYFTSHPAGIMSVPEMPARAFFIRQFLMQHLLAMPARLDDVIKKTSVWKKRLTYGGAVSAVLIASLMLGYDFHQSMLQANAVRNDLALYQLDVLESKDQHERLAKALPLLNSLQKAVNAETNAFSFTFYAAKSKKIASAAYHQALLTIVLPEVKNYFERYLQTASTHNPEQVYKMLRAYLMLGDSVHFQADSMSEIVQQMLPSDADKASLSALTGHIQAALQIAPLANQDNDLIAKTRKQLLALSNTALGFVILKNMGDNNADNAINLGTVLGNPPVLVSKGIATDIPAMFTAKEFNVILSDEVNVAASEALQGNWILGVHTSVDQAAIDALATQLRTQYIANYVDIWESLLANIQLSTPKDLTELDAMIGVLTGNNSPLLQLLDTIKVNTALEPVMTASPKLQSLSVMLTDDSNAQPNALYGIFVSLQQLHAYLQSLLTSPDSSTAISQAALQHMKHHGDDPINHIHTIAEQSPEPMKSWLNTIATKSWDFMLQE